MQLQVQSLDCSTARCSPGCLQQHYRNARQTALAEVHEF